MRLIDRTRTTVLAAARRWAARLPTPVGQKVRPASLAFHLTPSLPGDATAPGAPAVPDWSVLRAVVIDVVADQGPLPVHVLTAGRAPDRGALELIRLAHRLDCPVTVWTDGTGFSADGAAALLDVGCAAVAVTVASLDDTVQRRTVGNSVADACDAVVALATARTARAATVRLHLVVPWVAGVEDEARGLVGWAHQVGVDAVTVVPPSRGGAVGPLGEWPETLRGLGVWGLGGAEVRYLEALSQEDGTEPGVARGAADPKARFRPCPVVGTRMAVDARGELFACPFHPRIGPVGGSVRAAWTADTDHRAAVRGCTRRCRHPALALGPGLPGPWRRLR